MIGGEHRQRVPPKDRDIAMVFQNYALYPHMTVAENMSFGLRLKRYPKPRSRCGSTKPPACWISSNWSIASPKQLSGGQRQRVAMGRAIVRNPSFSVRRASVQPRCQAAGADAYRNQEGAPEVRTTTVYVTHDQVEAMTLADRVVVMTMAVSKDRHANELYHKPDALCAGFIARRDEFMACRLRTSAALHIRWTNRSPSRYLQSAPRDISKTAAKRENINWAYGPKHHRSQTAFRAGRRAFDTAA